MIFQRFGRNKYKKGKITVTVATLAKPSFQTAGSNLTVLESSTGRIDGFTYESEVVHTAQLRVK
jgi:hypothetical protein